MKFESFHVKVRGRQNDTIEDYKYYGDISNINQQTDKIAKTPLITSGKTVHYACNNQQKVQTQCRKAHCLNIKTAHDEFS
ncbi:MAG: hypothetical protein Q4F57_05770 [Weeksellaceae bacterium]|nr:hypothetical protein [Weeksellaceae bacterium]